MSDGQSEMWKVAILVAVAVAFSEGCAYKNAKCPDYIVVEQHADYQIRSYPSVTWATTSAVSRFTRLGEYMAFVKLSRYIQGANDRGQKMPMTVPVRMNVTRQSDNSTLFEMSFFVPAEFSDDPPVPTDSTVLVNNEDDRLYAVRNFTGYAWRQSTWEEEAERLAKSVESDETVDRTTHYRLNYDAPFDLSDRRNEIWMTKRNEGSNYV